MSATTPEQLARQKIDNLLSAGWTLQDQENFNRNAADGVDVRKFLLPNGPCDYLLFVGGKAAGAIEAKKTVTSNVAEQSAKYVDELPQHLARWSDCLIFSYESTGDETFFRDTRDPDSRSRRLFVFHQPEMLHAWLKETDMLRGRLQHMPPLDTRGLRDCQIDAVHGLEKSLSEDRPRSLMHMQMATADKTFTACTFSWRLLRHAVPSKSVSGGLQPPGRPDAKEYQ